MHLLYLNQWIPDSVLKALCWTFIHSLWLGLLAATAAAIVIALTRRSAARIRYNLLGAVLVLFIASAGITLYLQLQKPGKTAVVVSNVTVSVDETVTAGTTAGEVVVSSTNLWDDFSAYMNSHADWVMIIWSVFFLVQSIKLFAGLAGARRLRSYRVHAVNDEWQARIRQLSRQLGIRNAVSLLQSELVKIPVAVGYLKPVILVPLGLLSNLPAEQAETILLHELAHIRRRDFLINILQRIAEAIFFFNPALLWISSLIRQEREACCDDIVVANTSNKGSYLEALVSFQEYAMTGNYAMGISGGKYYLLNRVKRILTRENKKLNIMEKVFLVTGLLVIITFTFIQAQQQVAMKEKIAEVPVPATQPEVVTALAKQPSAVKPKPVRRIVNETRKPGEDRLVIVIDTVPVPQTNQLAVDELEFPSISATINNDGKQKTEMISVTDQHGRKYSFTRLNGKLTSLVVDGKDIPSGEMGKYEELVRKIDMTMKNNRAARDKTAKLRSLERLKNLRERNDEKERIDEKKRSIDEQKKRVDEQKKINDDSKKMIDEKKKTEAIKIKNDVLSRRMADNARARLEKQKERQEENKKRAEERMKRAREILRKIKAEAPTLNGREVIKKEVPAVAPKKPETASNAARSGNANGSATETRSANSESQNGSAHNTDISSKLRVTSINLNDRSDRLLLKWSKTNVKEFNLVSKEIRFTNSEYKPAENNSNSPKPEYKPKPQNPAESLIKKKPLSTGTATVI